MKKRSIKFKGIKKYPIQSTEKYVKKRFKSIDHPADFHETKLQGKMQRIIDRGYYQISRRFRTVACFPKGMTGTEALLPHAKKMRPDDAQQWVTMIGEGSAGDYFLRCYSGDHDNLIIVLTEEEYIMFRKLGGGCYDQKCVEKEYPDRSVNESGDVKPNVNSLILKRLHECNKTLSKELPE